MAGTAHGPCTAPARLCSPRGSVQGCPAEGGARRPREGVTGTKSRAETRPRAAWLLCQRPVRDAVSKAPGGPKWPWVCPRSPGTRPGLAKCPPTSLRPRLWKPSLGRDPRPGVAAGRALGSPYPVALWCGCAPAYPLHLHPAPTRCLARGGPLVCHGERLTRQRDG